MHQTPSSPKVVAILKYDPQSSPGSSLGFDQQSGLLHSVSAHCCCLHACRVEFREFVDGVRSLECSAVEWSRSMGVGLGAPLGEGLDVSMEKGRSVMTREGVRLPGLCRILHQIGGAELSPELTIQVCWPFCFAGCHCLYHHLPVQLHLSKRSWESHQLVLCTER